MMRQISCVRLLLLALLFTLLLTFAISHSNHIALNAGTLPPAPVVDLAIETSAPTGEVDNLQVITLLISVINLGPEAAPHVEIIDYLPLPYLELLTCEAGSDGTCSEGVASLTIRFAELSVGESQQITLTARTRSTFADPLHTYNLVQVSSAGVDNNLLDNHDSAPITVRFPFDLVLTATLTTPTPLVPEQPFQLAYSVTNASTNLPYRLEQVAFVNSALISMPDTTLFTVQPAFTYPALLTVSGVSSAVVDIDVSLYAISRTWSEDLDVLLIAPNGMSVTLLSDVGGATEINGIDLTFDDSAELNVPNVSVIPAGRYRPTNFARKDESLLDLYPAPGPGEVFDPAPLLGRFHGVDPNGLWKLYLIDDQPRDVGEIRYGWGITFTQIVTSLLPLIVTQEVPSEISFLGSVSTGWDIVSNGQTLTASLADLLAGPVPPLILNLTSPSDPGIYTTSASLKVLSGERLQANNVVQSVIDVTPIHDLTINGMVQPPTLSFGSPLTYTFVITNLGPSLALNPRTTIQLPLGIEIVQIRPSVGECSQLGATIECQLRKVQSVQRTLNDVRTIQVLAVTPSDGLQSDSLQSDSLQGGVAITASAIVSEEIDSDLANNSVSLTSFIANPKQFVYLPIISQ